MVPPVLMPESNHPKSALFKLLEQLVEDAVAWSETEIANTRTDAKSFLRNYAIALGFIFAGLSVLIATVLTLAETIIDALASYVHGHAVAGLIVSCGLFALTIGLLAAAQYFLKRKPRSRGLIFRRLTGAGNS